MNKRAQADRTILIVLLVVLILWVLYLVFIKGKVIS